VVVLAVRGPGAIEVCRKMMGATSGPKAEPGTIRGDYGISNTFNLIHGSDGTQTAQHELELFFEPHEIVDYERAVEPWVYDPDA
jgi:nucleoside-diphosphate kinase